MLSKNLLAQLFWPRHSKGIVNKIKVKGGRVFCLPKPKVWKEKINPLNVLCIFPLPSGIYKVELKISTLTKLMRVSFSTSAVLQVEKCFFLRFLIVS